jgi:hypothetical protein
VRAALLLLLVGCTTVHRLEADPHLSTIDRDAQVRFNDGRRIHSPYVEITGDAVHFEQDGAPVRAPLEAVQSVRWQSPESHRRGALEGAGIGLLTGATLGAILAFASADDSCTPQGSQNWFSCVGPRFSAGQKAAIFAVPLGVVGSVAGALGGSIGRHDELQITSPR